ncbi:hypothetical protein BKA64DRAFT_687582 [Cadophora sp. MPI-SDFR-AT-0126]|nr:hypothetical protein BKA64DRAFT_687582 [Leotiomycetes sp. MPI-SDFR-AT-0126]
MQAPSKPHGVPTARKPRAVKTSNPRSNPMGKQPITQPVPARNTPLELRPAGALPTKDAEKAMRRQVAQGLPKGRRPVIRNRVELLLPSELLQVSPLDDFQSLRIPASRAGRTTWVPDAAGVRPVDASISEEDFDSDDLWYFPTSISPVTVLGAGRVDPFGNYPIKITQTEQWLLDEVHTNPNPLFRTFQEAWLPSAIHNSAMFHQVLANIAINIYTIQGRESTNVISMRHHSSAMRYINSVIADPVKGVGDGVVRSVGTFVCYSAYTENFASLDIHLGGLERIVELRGGWNSFDHSETWRCQLFGVDIAGACRRDSETRFPLPDTLIQEVHTTNHSPTIGAYGTSPFLASCLGLYKHDQLLLKAFHDLSIAIDYVERKSRLGEAWADIKFFVFWIDPIVHSLVGQEFSEESKSLQEVTRLGLLLFLSKTRRYCGQLGVSTRCFNTKLRSLVTEQDLSNFGVLGEKVLLWALFMGSVESMEKSDQDWYIDKLAEVTYKMGSWSWTETLAAVKEFIWIREVFDADQHRFRQRFEGVLNDLIVSRLSSTYNED